MWLKNLDPKQREAAEAPHSEPLLICAGAGSGKTRVIMTRVAWLMERIGIDPTTILALSFTKKACQVSVSSKIYGHVSIIEQRIIAGNERQNLQSVQYRFEIHATDIARMFSCRFCEGPPLIFLEIRRYDDQNVS